MSSSNPSTQGSGNFVEEEAEILEEAGEWKLPRKQGLLNQQDQHTYEFMEPEARYTGTAWFCTRWSYS